MYRIFLPMKPSYISKPTFSKNFDFLIIFDNLSKNLKKNHTSFFFRKLKARMFKFIWLFWFQLNNIRMIYFGYFFCPVFSTPWSFVQLMRCNTKSVFKFVYVFNFFDCYWNFLYFRNTWRNRTFDFFCFSCIIDFQGI